MLISEDGINLIRQHEGCRLEAYPCPGGVWTVGYGHTRSAHAGLKITQAQAEELLKSDVDKVNMALQKYIQVSLEQRQWDALGSFVFNVGEGAFARSSLLKLLNQGQFADIPAQLMRWTYAKGQQWPGLVRRRRDEAALWRGLNDAELLKPHPKSLQVEVSPPKPLRSSSTLWSTATLATGATAQALKEIAAVSETVTVTAQNLETIMKSVLTSPWLWLAGLMIGLACWIAHERLRARKEWGR